MYFYVGRNVKHTRVTKYLEYIEYLQATWKNSLAEFVNDVSCQPDVNSSLNLAVKREIRTE